MDMNLLWLALIVLLAFTSHAMSGFGSVIIAVTLGSMFYPIKTLLPMVVPLDILISGYIVFRYRQDINGPLLIRQIAPFMLMGLALGLMLFVIINGELLKRVYGGFIILICLRELFRGNREPPALGRIKSLSFTLAAGTVQGMFASGGPLIAYAVGRMNMSKTVFRSTLCVVWLVCNITLTLVYREMGRLTGESLRSTGMLVPAVLLGGFIGDRLHSRVNESVFRMLVYVLLTLAGLTILVV